MSLDTTAVTIDPPSPEPSSAPQPTNSLDATLEEPPAARRSADTLLVVAAVLITNDPSPRVLLAERPAGKKHEGLWEFPGGKVEVGECPEEALVRELKEELDIDVDQASLEPLTFTSSAMEQGAGQWRLPRHLLMVLFSCVDGWSGAPTGAEGQQVRWVTADEMVDFSMPPADVPTVPVVRARLAQLAHRATQMRTKQAPGTLAE